MFVVTLDTEPFRREHLYFASKRFKQLAELVQKGEVRVILTDIVAGEIARAIVERTREAIEFLKQAATRRILGPIAQSESAKLLGSVLKLEHGLISAEVQAKFHELVSLLKVEIISTDAISVKDLRDSYFAATPPFAKADKKHEFPDAMSLLALRDYAQQRQITIHVVSGDKDFEAAVKTTSEFQYYETVPDFVSAVLTHVASTKKAADAALAAAEALRDDIATATEEEFLHASFYVDEVDGEVNDIHVRDVDVTRFYVTEVSGESVTLEYSATVEFAADVSYGDPDRTAYDAETGEFMVFGHLEDEVINNVHVSGSLLLIVDVDDPAQSTIDRIGLTSDDYRVKLSEE